MLTLTSHLFHRLQQRHYPMEKHLLEHVINSQ